MSITTITAANTAPVRSGDLCNKRIGATGKPVFYIPELGSEAVEHFVLTCDSLCEGKAELDWYRSAGGALVMAVGDLTVVKNVLLSQLPVLRTAFHACLKGRGFQRRGNWCGGDFVNPETGLIVDKGLETGDVPAGDTVFADDR